MKSRTLIIIVMLFTAACTVKNEHHIVLADDPGIQQQGKYLLFRGKLFSGMLKDHFANGELKNQAEYEGGLLHGKTQTGYENGQVESLRFYLDGEKEGVHQGWWPDGKLRFEYHFSEGLYHGSFREWYASGKPFNHFEYEEGQEVSAIGWKESGKTYINFVIRNGRKYGLTNSRLCYSLKDEQGVYLAKP